MPIVYNLFTRCQTSLICKSWLMVLSTQIQKHKSLKEFLTPYLLRWQAPWLYSFGYLTWSAWHGNWTLSFVFNFGNVLRVLKGFKDERYEDDEPIYNATITFLSIWIFAFGISVALLGRVRKWFLEFIMPQPIGPVLSKCKIRKLSSMRF